MLLKLFGAVIVIVTGGGYGFVKSMELQQVYERLLYVKRFMLLLKGEIRYTKAPLQDAFYQVGNRCDSPCREFCMELSGALEARSGKQFDEIWKEIINRHKKQLLLPSKQFDRLHEFGGSLGFLDDTMQLRMIDLYIEELDTDMREMQAGLQTRQKLYRCLGIMSGLFTAVVLF